MCTYSVTLWPWPQFILVATHASRKTSTMLLRSATDCYGGGTTRPKAKPSQIPILIGIPAVWVSETSNSTCIHPLNKTWRTTTANKLKASLSRLKYFTRRLNAQIIYELIFNAKVSLMHMILQVNFPYDMPLCRTLQKISYLENYRLHFTLLYIKC